MKFKHENIVNYGQPYIIAELGSNHNGDMELAKKLIVEAKKAGADCVKFQSWSKDTVFSRKKYEDNYFIGDDYRNREDYSLEEIVEEFAISENELLEMKNFADEVGIDCTSTPFSKKEADFLVEKMHTPFIKTASMDLNNYPYLEYLAKFGKPMVVSTGLSEFYEIDKAIRTIEKAGNKKIIILHCVASYPPKDEDVNLNKIETLQKAYPDYPVGFSDHTLGTCIPLAAVSKGACIIEKHFTLDKDMFGWDHKVSATPSELEQICQNSIRINKSLGTNRICSVEEDETKKEFRRSIVITRDIKKGEIIKEEDLDFKRPGTGLSPEEIKYVIGRELKKDMKYDEILLLEDLR